MRRDNETMEGFLIRSTPILDSGQLARVHVFRKRLPMMHRAGWEGRKANSGMAFAWFIWDRDHKGPTELHRLSWEESGVDAPSIANERT